MSWEPNETLLIQAVELADSLNDEAYYAELDRLMADNDLEGVWQLCKIMSAHKRQSQSQKWAIRKEGIS